MQEHNDKFTCESLAMKTFMLLLNFRLTQHKTNKLQKYYEYKLVCDGQNMTKGH